MPAVLTPFLSASRAVICAAASSCPCRRSRRSGAPSRRAREQRLERLRCSARRRKRAGAGDRRGGGTPARSGARAVGGGVEVAANGSDMLRTASTRAGPRRSPLLDQRHDALLQSAVMRVSSGDSAATSAERRSCPRGRREDPPGDETHSRASLSTPSDSIAGSITWRRWRGLSRVDGRTFRGRRFVPSRTARGRRPRADRPSLG